MPEGSNQYVFVVTDGIVEQRRVELGRRIPGFVAIENGLEAGETIITEGTHKVRDGVPVEVIQQSAQDTSRADTDRT